MYFRSLLVTLVLLCLIAWLAVATLNENFISYTYNVESYFKLAKQSSDAVTMLGYMEKYRTALDMRIYDKSSHGTFSFMSPANAVSERFILLDSLIRRIKSVTELKLNSQDYLTAMGGLYSGLNAFDDSNKVFWMASILQNSSWHSKYLASGVYLALFIFLSIIIILTVHKWERRNF